MVQLIPLPIVLQPENNRRKKNEFVRSTSRFNSRIQPAMQRSKNLVQISYLSHPLVPIQTCEKFHFFNSNQPSGTNNFFAYAGRRTIDSRQRRDAYLDQFGRFLVDERRQLEHRRCARDDG
jgi:hypothetical protein